MNVEIINILDRSGSMEKLRTDTIGGLNGYLMEQRTLPGHARATLILFNSEIETVYEGVNIAHLGNLTQAQYVTIGSTALADAIGMTFMKQGERIAREAWTDKVIVNIFTDGEENASRKFTVEGAKALIKLYEDDKGWAVLFQGAGIDAFKAAETFGISGANTRGVAASSAGVAEAYGNMSMYSTSIRTGA
jgi:hypothetical protein